MHPAPRSFLPDIFEQHLEAIGFLWGRRRSALRSPDYTLAEFCDLEDRITAHLHGVLAAGDLALPILEDRLSEDDPLLVFAAAHALLHHESEATVARLLDAFAQSADARLAGLREAFCHGPARALLPQIEQLYHAAATPVATAAAEVLAFHSALRATPQDTERLLRDEDPRVRQRGWLLIGYLGARVEPKTYAAAMRDRDAAVRRTALHAGAWCGEPGILPACRKLATDAPAESLDALELLAILGGPEDLPRFRALGDTRELGPLRFRPLGTFGQPALMDTVLDGIADPDPATAVAAGAAFAKMTGQGVDSDRRAKLPPEGGGAPDELEAEFQEEVTLPDPELARRMWERVPPWARAGRLCRGLDVSAQLTPEAFAALDMESRWEVCLRARYSGAWSGTPLRLERFPQQPR